MCVCVCLFFFLLFSPSFSFFLFLFFDCITYGPTLVRVKKWKQVIALMDFYIPIHTTGHININTHIYANCAHESSTTNGWLIAWSCVWTDDTPSGQQTSTLTDWLYLRQADRQMHLRHVVFLFLFLVLLFFRTDGLLLLR